MNQLLATLRQSAQWKVVDEVVCPSSTEQLVLALKGYEPSLLEPEVWILRQYRAAQ
jgi:hypothetical protein